MTPGLTITCEVFCSETKLRTSNARIRWHATKPGPEAARLLAGTPTLQATVFAQGFEKNLYVTVPSGPGAPRQAAAVPRQAERQQPLRAFQFRVLQVEQARTSAAGTPESGVVIEDLEPGMLYRWRLVIEAGGASIISPVVVCKASVCPADIIRQPLQPQECQRP